MDRGVQFAAGIMKKLNQMLEIDTKLLMAYYPQTDSQTERMNQDLEQYLRMFIDLLVRIIARLVSDSRVCI